MQTTAKQQTTGKRQSREAQYNQRVQAAYESIRAMGHRHENDLLELFSVASQSTPGMRYQVTHDLVSGRMHCTCLAGVNERATCVHRAAVARWLSERAAQINQAVNQVAQSRMAEVLAQMTHQPAQPRSQEEADWQRDTSILRRDNRPFDLMR